MRILLVFVLFFVSFLFLCFKSSPFSFSCYPHCLPTPPRASPYIHTDHRDRQTDQEKKPTLTKTVGRREARLGWQSAVPPPAPPGDGNEFMIDGFMGLMIDD